MQDHRYLREAVVEEEADEAGGDAHVAAEGVGDVPAHDALYGGAGRVVEAPFTMGSFTVTVADETAAQMAIVVAASARTAATATLAILQCCLMWLVMLCVWLPRARVCLFIGGRLIWIWSDRTTSI